MKRSLKKTHPKLAAEWDFKKNLHDINDITYGSNKIIWWICKNDHSWQISPKRRTQGKVILPCPECNSLEFNHPDLLEEWDYEKNKINPKEVPRGSQKEIWWICKEITCNYSWKATPLNRAGVNKSGCPMCQGMILSSKNRLSTKHPDLIKEWHPTKNKKQPSEFFENTRQKAWWICPVCNYEYQAQITHRVKNHSNCSACSGRDVTDKNRLTIINPKLAKEWHPSKNKDLKPSDFSFGSQKKVWWKCSKNHEWQAVIKNRDSGAGCPECKPQSSKLEIRIYCELKEIFKNIEWRKRIEKKEIDVFLNDFDIGLEIDGSHWHKDSNEKDLKKNSFFKSLGINIIRIRTKPLKALTNNDILIHENESDSKVLNKLLNQLLLIINKGDIKKVIKRYLNNQKFLNDEGYKRILSFLPGPTPENSLLKIFPHVAKKWDYEGNFPLRPEMFYPRTNTRVSWICEINSKHIWTAPISSLSVTKSGCPFCDNKRVLRENSFGARYPKFLEEYDYKKNIGKDPFNHTIMSQIRVWWKCKFCEAPFNLSFASRTISSGIGCKTCRKKNN